MTTTRTDGLNDQAQLERCADLSRTAIETISKMCDTSQELLRLMGERTALSDDEDVVQIRRAMTAVLEISRVAHNGFGDVDNLAEGDKRNVKGMTA